MFDRIVRFASLYSRLKDEISTVSGHFTSSVLKCSFNASESTDLDNDVAETSGEPKSCFSTTITDSSAPTLIAKMLQDTIIINMQIRIFLSCFAKKVLISTPPI